MFHHTRVGPALKGETVYTMGVYLAAHPILTLQHSYVHALAPQLEGAGQAGNAGSYHDGISFHEKGFGYFFVRIDGISR